MSNLKYAPHGHGPDHGEVTCPSRARPRSRRGYMPLTGTAQITARLHAPHGHGP